MNRKFFNVYGGGQIHRARRFTWQPQSAIRGFSKLADFGGLGGYTCIVTSDDQMVDKNVTS